MIPTTKTCPSCKKEKSAEEFGTRRGGTQLNGYCRDCRRDKKRAKKLRDLELNPKSQPKIRKPRVQSPETRKLLSEIRTKWLKDNPDKHPWRKKGDDKFKSVPCEKMKEFLTSKGLIFAAEYQPEVGGRHFSIDIAFPDKKIAIEVNGTQHYERDGKLKPYYQERHDILEANGWQVYEVYYSMCYNLEKWETMIPVILTADKKVDFDYLTYVPRSKKEKNNKCQCGERKRENSAVCRKCHRAKKPYINTRVSKEELEKLLSEMPMTKVGEMFGVGSNAVKKWCKNYGIILGERRGYWQKRESGMTHEEALSKNERKESTN